ncbi:MAG TPA: hypothetical protein VHR86_06030, partial [Armatimonadota bacterium]|nr:hypothetical protein [Armatimonadota bacterium]
NVRVWESQDKRFPFVLRTLASDTAGNGLESEITALGLNIAVADRLFRLPNNVSFLPPPEVRRGQRIAGAPKPVTTPVAISLADAVKGEKATANRTVVNVNGVQLALDATPVAGESDIDEVRLEPYNSGSLFTGQAVVLYLKHPASVRLAHAAAAALGRYVVVQVGGEAVSAFRIGSPWAEENNRVLILDPSLERLKELIQRFGGKKEKPAAGKVQL